MTFQYITNEQLNGFDSYKYSCKGIFAFFSVEKSFLLVRDTNQYIAEKFIAAIYCYWQYHYWLPSRCNININIELLVATYCPSNINFDFSKIAILKIRLIFILAAGPQIYRVTSNFHVSHYEF